ncbi:response regulator [Corallococcus coralloides DSM 2259]|uniref:Response regulator n=2 Tax=Corallococcus coralloides TaxID=184914 RepID=H8MER4_CORCM|nr:response regulator [Corallococcus coralloides]AFE09921.1 response regulator [Corallococcus coralloides DSM 2259]QAT82205.1 response regulator [Corallococcus coralloides]
MVPATETVLVVDDEQGILEALADLLREEGYRVLTASHGREALERMAEVTPDLVLTDWMMPVLDGPALIARIQQDPVLRHIPVLGMSAVDVNGLKRLHPGMEFLQKPFDIRALMKLVRRALDANPRVRGG